MQSNLESYVSIGLDGNGIETCLTTVLLSVHEAVSFLRNLWRIDFPLFTVKGYRTGGVCF